MGNLIDPMLEREEGFKGFKYFPKFARDTGNRVTKLTKLEFLMALDHGTPPP